MGNDLLTHLAHKYELQCLVAYTRPRTCCVDVWVSARGKSMKIFVFLFPQFNFSAPKEEAYFKMLSEDELLACRMKETHLRYSFCFSTLFSYYHRKHWGGGGDVVLHIHPLVLLYIRLASVLNLSSSSFLFVVCVTSFISGAHHCDQTRICLSFIFVTSHLWGV